MVTEDMKKMVEAALVNSMVMGSSGGVVVIGEFFSDEAMVSIENLARKLARKLAENNKG